MLKVRVIPTLLWKQFGLVKGVGFDSWRRVGTILPAIKVYCQREVDELILLDIVAHKLNDDPDFESIGEFGRECCVPLTVGGGITRPEQVLRLLRSGADKVSVNTAAYAHPELVSEIAKRHGVQCVVASIDVRTDHTGSDWRCFSHAGRHATGRDVRDWARELEGRGAGENPDHVDRARRHAAGLRSGASRSRREFRKDSRDCFGWRRDLPTHG